MPAPDLQHQRLRHMFASAILELWKKETGSVTSVLIEGTVCLTVHGGRTTVVQLCDRFAGLVNGDCERPLDVGSGGTLQRSDGHLYVAPATPKTPAKTRARPAIVTTPQSKDSNNNVRSATQDVDDVAAAGGSVDSDDDECSVAGDDDVDDGRSSMLVDDEEATGTQSNVVSGQTLSSSGSYSPETGGSDDKLDVDETADDSAIHDMSMNRTSLPDDSLSILSPQHGVPNPVPSNSGNDLLLSSPHDYTAQVRNVIRQRLLNATGKQPPSSFRANQASASLSMTTPMNAVSRTDSSPYYRATAEATPPSLWVKRETPSAAASEAMATAARRLASQYAAAAASHIPMTLMSPPPALAMSVGLPLPGVPLNASLHNLLGMKSTATPPRLPVLMPPGSVSPHLLPSTPDSKRAGGTPASGGVDPPSAGTSGDSGQTSSEQKIYRCDYCNKTFLFKSKYHEHLPVHTSARPFQCHLCTRTYKYKYDLRVHLRTHLGIPTKSTVCPFCATRFATNKFLRQHMREAHSEQNGGGLATAPPTGMGLISPDNAAEVPPVSESVEEDRERDDGLETDVMADNCNDAAAESPVVAGAEAANNAAELSYSGEV